jgi:acyl transferase domain-containing protein
MQQQPAGCMLAVQLSEKDIERFLNRGLSLAVVNTPSYCVISGEEEAIKQLESDLEKSNRRTNLPFKTHPREEFRK